MSAKNFAQPDQQQQVLDQPFVTIPNNNRDQKLQPLKPVIEHQKLSISNQDDLRAPPPPVQQQQQQQRLPKLQRSFRSMPDAQPKVNNSTTTNNSKEMKKTAATGRPRRVLSRFETAPSDGWKLIKKWVGNNKQGNKIKEKQLASNIERQAEVNSLTPLIMAMFFTKDEDDKNRIPVFLNNMSVKVMKLEENDEDYFNTKQQQHKKKKFRGTVFKITVQYGTGSGKISWSVYRRYWDFVKLHYRYKKSNGAGTTLVTRSSSRLPNFPSLPRHHFRKQRKRDYECRAPISRLNTSASSSSSVNASGVPTTIKTNPNSLMDEDEVMALVHSSNAIVSNQPTTSSTNAVPPSTSHAPTAPNQSTTSAAPSVMSSQVMEVVKADTTVLQAMENYLNQFIVSIEPCGYINRLCKFLEISALGLHLAAKYSNPNFHGKEGFAVFQSRTDRDPKQSRNLLEDGLVCSFPTTGGRRRRKPKWFIVRESYVVCVDDPSECEIYDVFLFDQAFDVHRLAIFGGKSGHHNKNDKKKLSNALVNASHWTLGKATLCLKNMQGVYHFRAKNEQQAKQFESSIRHMAHHSIWLKENRFKSFTPIRYHAAASWFVDGRDYFWDVSVALENAKERIYIHDWWLSPELFLRRPAAKNLEWRLDRVLRRKADQGVKVYIVMYKEVAMALPLFSHQAKRHLLSLSPNIFVQRHPSRAIDIFKKDSVFFWAHHEKICVVDNEVAFIGGLDQCFGRYDTPGHTLVDDLNPDLSNQITNDNLQIWPGKDYSNPRIIDFHTLDKPFEDNQDRSTLPRMPWHDVSMRLVGQAVRDVSRHFVQRWNFLRRKKPSAPKRPTPMLLPVPDNHESMLNTDDPRICHPHTTESCRVQILRSVSPWSIGSMEHVEHSIQTAYVESIQESKYLIYIENQFFVTSTKSGNTVIENKFGEAIFQRIMLAHKKGEKWRAIIVVPLVPGFPANVDETEGSTVCMIMRCQYLSVARGPDSLIGRLHAAGVYNTHEYINVYGLRNWGELNGQFVTEQVYIHAKTMVVDDRRVIIGSANINERSQLGTRDSEIAACIEDDGDMMDSFFDGKPVKVGKFAHTLRMRLMGEHIGLDVDQLDREKFNKDATTNYYDESVWNNYQNSDKDKVDVIPPYIEVTSTTEKTAHERDKIQQEEKDEVPMSEIKDFAIGYFSDSSDTASHGSSYEESGRKAKLKRKTKELAHHHHKFMSKEEKEYQHHPSQRSKEKIEQETTEELQTVATGGGGSSAHSGSLLSPTKSIFNKLKSTKEDYLDFWTSLDCDTDNNGDIKAAREAAVELQTPAYYSNPEVELLKLEDKTVGQVCRILQDPLSDEFQNFWHNLARVNTDLFRRSFLVAPDNNIRNWDQYHHYSKMAKLFLGRTDVKHGGTKTTAAAANVTTLPLDNMDGKEDTIADIIKHIRGHLVIWPNHFMEEDDGRNEFLFSVDKIAPLEIFD